MNHQSCFLLIMNIQSYIRSTGSVNTTVDIKVRRESVQVS